MKHFLRSNLFVAVLLFLNSCVGVDYIDDRGFIVERDLSRIEIDESSFALFINENRQINPTYYNSKDQVEQVTFEFASEDATIASVSDDGTVTAVADGQTKINVSYENLSAEVLVSVVSDSNKIAMLEIMAPSKTSTVGGTLQFTARAFNFLGNDITANVNLVWKTSDAALGTIDANGLFTAIQNGEVSVWAEVEDFKSVACVVEVGATELNATFSGLSGYNVTGSVKVEKESDTKIRVTLSADFRADSGPGLYLYMSNQQGSIIGGLDLGKLKSNNGEQSYVADAGLFDYGYVIVHCRPFNVPFGSSTKLQ